MKKDGATEDVGLSRIKRKGVADNEVGEFPESV